MFLGFSDSIEHNSFNIIKQRKNKMKHLKPIGHCMSVLLLLICLATPAAAIPIAVVGSVDNFLASAKLSNSGKGQEESWISDVLGFAVNIDFKDDETAGSGWEFVTGSGDHWAHSLVTEPAHYLLKLGVGNSGADTHYLFENLAALSWAVIDKSALFGGQALGAQTLRGNPLNFNFGRVSHIAEIDGTVRLSEPGSIGLLMLGFALLGGLMARKFRI